MAWQLWPALTKNDKVLVPSLPPQDYLDYLESLGLELPQFVIKSDRNHVFTPFGWNAEAEEKNLRYLHPSSHPNLDVVKRVNSREFGLRLEAELFSEPHSSPPLQGREGWGVPVFCADPETLRQWLKSAAAGRWVAKGNHGHAGIGQLRFSLPEEAGEIFEKLVRILESQSGLVLEREHKIAVEFGCLFLLSKTGLVESLRCHRLLSYSGGGFAGAVLLPGDPELKAWLSSIQEAVTKIGEGLHREGYFGPVGIDMYAHEENRLRFRALVDLNARVSMAFPVHGLATRFPGKAVLLSQSPSSIPLPKNPPALREKLGSLQFDPKTKRGVFLITPLMPGPRRHAFAFIGKDEADVQSMRRKTLQALA